MDYQTASERYAGQNAAAARIIAADPAKYGGPDSLMCQWARLVIERAQPTIKGPLFRAA
jgi:hypothetical protein